MDIKTKFSLGDTVYIKRKAREGIVSPARVVSIKIETNSHLISTWYKLYGSVAFHNTWHLEHTLLNEAEAKRVMDQYWGRTVSRAARAKAWLDAHLDLSSSSSSSSTAWMTTSSSSSTAWMTTSSSSSSSTALMTTSSSSSSESSESSSSSSSDSSEDSETSSSSSSSSDWSCGIYLPPMGPWT